ncbi:MAG TPA: hypothetical protein VGP64_15175 [Polyangia bacterium]
MVERSGVVGAAAIMCALGACSAQSLGPPHDGGLRPPSGQRPPSSTLGTAADGGAPSGIFDGGPPSGSGNPGGSSAPGDAGPRAAGTDGGAGASAEPAVELAPTTVLSAASVLSAEVIAADSDGIYWLLPYNQLWMLPTGSDSPRDLAVDTTGSPALLTAYPGVLVASGQYLFWVAKVSTSSGGTRQTLHRTKKGGGDDILVDDLKTVSAQGLAVDNRYLYWTQDLEPGQTGTAQILGLPLDATPGTTPVPLVTISSSREAFSLAADDQYLYWTPWDATGTTQDPATVWRGDKSGLLNGTSAGAPYVDLSATFLWPYAGSLYVLYNPTPSTTALGRADVAGGVATLALKPGWLTFFGDCVLSSTAVAGTSPHQGFIDAMPLAGGAPQVEVAVDVAVPPVVGVPGLVFINGLGQLVAISPTDFRAALASGEP